MLRTPEGPRLVRPDSNHKKTLKWIGGGVAAVVAVAVLSQLPSCKAERPSLGDVVPTQPAPTNPDTYKEKLDKGNWSTDEPGRLAGITAHRSLSDLTYPENPSKTVDIGVNCAVLPAKNPNKRWVIQNPLVTSQKSRTGEHQLGVFAAVIPLEHRREDGALHFFTMQAVSVDGEMIMGELGEMPHGGIDVTNVRLERTKIPRNPAEMPPELFGDSVVYLEDVYGNNPPDDEAIPAHATYVPEARVGEYCLVMTVERKKLESALA